QLVRDGAEHAVVVETGLTDRHDPRVRGPADDPVPAGVVHLGGIVRVDPHRGVETGVSVDAGQGALRGRDVPAGDEDPLHAGRPGGFERLTGIVVEPVGVEVAVGV